MSVLILCISDSWGGLEQVAAEDAIVLHNKGISVRVLSHARSPFCQYIKQNAPNIDHHTVDYRPRNHFDLSLRKEIKNLISLGVNIIHVHQPSLLGSVVPWLIGCPQISLFASRHIQSSHAKKSIYHKWLYSRLDALIVMSQSLRENVLVTHAISSERVAVIPLGLDFTRYDPKLVDRNSQRKTWGVTAEDTVVIGLVGRIDRAKGQDLLIHAAAGLRSELGSPVPFKIVIIGEETRGQASNYLNELKDLVKTEKLENLVFFAGFQENVPQVMRSIDILVMPSRQEAFGRVAIEAMAMECPVIVSQGGSAREIVAEQEYGLTTRVGDVFDLQSKIKYLMTHPEFRKMMGKKARVHVLSHFDHSIRISKTRELYIKSRLKRNN